MRCGRECGYPWAVLLGWRDPWRACPASLATPGRLTDPHSCYGTRTEPDSPSTREYFLDESSVYRGDSCVYREIWSSAPACLARHAECLEEEEEEVVVEEEEEEVVEEVQEEMQGEEKQSRA
ncbi:hypothetical protein E2C01_016229 [Portunus trituberculatus]|uniref:Uncharacterized protein n=1 Tax=Portunus trituberculatus TaxID=210409 RepID=A0A5B7DNV6_PORTR|nr:hypothetical protein [Portunus trituberculatus]